MQMDELMRLMQARRSIRRYQADRPVEREKIETLLRAAMCAPSACNLQPWEFIVVQGEEPMTALRATISMGDYNAPLAVVVLANPANIPWSGNGYQIDCAAAIENMLLAATAMGLGSVWLGSYDGPALRRLYNIPESVVPVGVVYFGYPDQERPPVSWYTPEAVYWDRYDPERVRNLRTIDMLKEDP